MFFSTSLIPLFKTIGNILPELYTRPGHNIPAVIAGYQMLRKYSILISTQNSLVYTVIHTFHWTLLLAASCALDPRILILVSNPLQQNSSLLDLCRLQ